MKMQFVLGNEGRKGLVKAVGEILGVTPRYLGAPSFCYEVGKILIDRDGVLSAPDDMNADELVDDFKGKGFVLEHQPERFVISYPADGITERAVQNLENMIQAKASLIQKALKADSLSVKEEEGKVVFDWFAEIPSPEEITAYSQFLASLVQTAKDQLRVTAKPIPVENEKYAMRCFLLRLGFIGDEYKESRKILLSRLSGNSAFRHGKPEE